MEIFYSQLPSHKLSLKMPPKSPLTPKERAFHTSLALGHAPRNGPIFVCLPFGCYPLIFLWNLEGLVFLSRANEAQLHLLHPCFRARLAGLRAFREATSIRVREPCPQNSMTNRARSQTLEVPKGPKIERIQDLEIFKRD